jgi:hypothetical protein
LRAFALHTLAGLALCLFEHVEGDIPKDGKMLCRLPGANAAHILMKHHIPHPLDLVFTPSGCVVNTNLHLNETTDRIFDPSPSSF